MRRFIQGLVMMLAGLVALAVCLAHPITLDSGSVIRAWTGMDVALSLPFFVYALAMLAVGFLAGTIWMRCELSPLYRERAQLKRELRAAIAPNRIPSKGAPASITPAILTHKGPAPAP